MEQTENPAGGYSGMPQMKTDLPNATVILVLGILSIPTCMCYGIVGIGLGITAMIMGNKALALYRSNPDLYNLSSYKNVNAGRICGIVGIVLGAIYLILTVIGLSFLGSNPDFFEMMNNR